GFANNASPIFMRAISRPIGSSDGGPPSDSSSGSCVSCGSVTGFTMNGVFSGFESSCPSSRDSRAPGLLQTIRVVCAGRAAREEGRLRELVGLGFALCLEESKDVIEMTLKQRLPCRRVSTAPLLEQRQVVRHAHAAYRKKFETRSGGRALPVAKGTIMRFKTA